MKTVYFNMIMGIERLHRQFFEVIKSDLNRYKIKDLSDIQCFIIYNIGREKITVGDISHRGFYMGSNITYNLKKMVQNDYVIQEQSNHDRRSSHITLSNKGMEIYNRFEAIFEIHIGNLGRNNITKEELESMSLTMRKLESFWRFSANHNLS